VTGPTLAADWPLRQPADTFGVTSQVAIRLDLHRPKVLVPPVPGTGRRTVIAHAGGAIMGARQRRPRAARPPRQNAAALLRQPGHGMTVRAAPRLVYGVHPVGLSHGRAGLVVDIVGDLESVGWAVLILWCAVLALEGGPWVNVEGVVASMAVRAALPEPVAVLGLEVGVGAGYRRRGCPDPGGWTRRHICASPCAGVESQCDLESGGISCTRSHPSRRVEEPNLAGSRPALPTRTGVSPEAGRTITSRTRWAWTACRTGRPGGARRCPMS